MTVTAGVDEIQQRLTGVRAGAAATLEVSLGRLARALESEQRRRANLAAAVSYIPGIAFKPFTGASLPAVPGAGTWPTPGYTWAVQAIRMAGLGVADVVNLYRGTDAHAAVDNNALWTFTVPVAGAVSAWHPGGKGLLLSGNGQAALLFAGTSASGALTVNMDVIQIADAQLPFYLL